MAKKEYNVRLNKNEGVEKKMKKIRLVLLLMLLFVLPHGCMMWQMKCGLSGGLGCPTDEDIRASYQGYCLRLAK